MLEKKPFENYTLDSEKKDKQDIVPLRLNKEERFLLERDKKFLMSDRDGTTIKMLMVAGREVLHAPFLYPFLKVFLKKKANKEEIDL